MPRTLVILHPGGLGDLLLAVPAVHHLRERFPAHEILLCGHDEGARFLVECGLVDRSLSIQTAACTAVFAGAAPANPLVQDSLNRCDLAVAWTSDKDGTIAAALKRCGVSVSVVRSPFDSGLKSVHQSDRFLEIVGGHNGQSSTKPLWVPQLLRREATEYLAASGMRGGPLAVVHPGSGSRHKCVKPEILRPVLEGLQAQGLEPVLLEGPADAEMVDRLRSHLSFSPPLVRGLSIRLLAGVLSQVELFVGHDSGVTHLAARLGIPTVSLFGPTDPGRWAPLSPMVTVVKDKPCGCPSWETVKQCQEQPCLDLSPSIILDACFLTRAVPLNPRIC